MSGRDAPAEAESDVAMRVHVVGTGLIGASIGLALGGAGHDVTLGDRHPAALQLAVALGAGRAVADRPGAVDVVVVAVPPAAVARVAVDWLAADDGCTVMDIASIKGGPLADVEACGGDMTRVVGSHPMAGRERSGPGAARADLFVGRPWVMCPTAATSESAMTRGRRVVRDCGAVAVEMSAAEHDRAVALVSHLPQVAASMTARRLLDAPDSFLALAGTGVRDTTRVAASDPELWVQILAGNAAAVAEQLLPLIDDLTRVRAALVSGGDGPDAVRDEVDRLLDDGRRGRARLPGKHGAPHATYQTVPVVIADRPGELARLLLAAGDAEVNVEDISIEHSPGQPVGLVELLVQPSAVGRLASSLRGAGWDVHVEESRPAD